MNTMVMLGTACVGGCVGMAFGNSLPIERRVPIEFLLLVVGWMLLSWGL
jgi:hypothetical protein